MEWHYIICTGTVVFIEVFIIIIEYGYNNYTLFLYFIISGTLKYLATVVFIKISINFN